MTALATMPRRPAALLRITPIWLVLVAVVVVAALVSGRFLSTANLLAVLHQGVITGIVALGMTIVLIGGHFDLSSGAVVMMAAVIALLVGPADPAMTVTAVLLPLLAGALVGTVNGMIVYRGRANSIVATIGMQFVIVGAVLAAVSGQHVRADGISAAFDALSNARPLGVPLPVLLFATLVVALSVLMSETAFGRHIYAIGGDLETARRSGVPVVRRGVVTFALSGTLAALSGVLVASRVGHLDPTGVAQYEFPALTAAVLGGTSLTGGVGRPADTAAAILVVAVITNVMTLLNYQYAAQLLVQGLVLTAAVAFYSWRRREG